LASLLEELKMGLLDEIVGAALGAKGQPSQGQMGQGRPAQDQFSQIAAALTALLASRPAPQSAGQGASASQTGPSGLDALVNQFRQSGLEDVINSWIGTGQNQAISPNELREALGQKTVNDLSRQSGATQDDLLTQLSKYLPAVIDRLTPNGQLPTQADIRSAFKDR
jgi:uncharacterized protein YidB (DUF937 family)